MSIQGFQAKQRDNTSEYVDHVLPEDSYQCSIEKVELREGTKYMSTETEMQLLFYLKPLGVDETFKDKLLFFQTTTSFFNGKSTKAKSNVKSSKLYNIIRTVYRFYKPDVKVDEMKSEEITDEVINYLEGKQLMAIVKLSETGKNKVTDIMSIKKEIETGKKEKTPDEELKEIVGE